MPPMEERVKYNKKHFQIQSQISYIAVRAYDGEKLYKIRQFPIRHSPHQYSTFFYKKKPSKHKDITPELINTHSGAEPQFGINCISSPDPFSLKGSIFVFNSRHLFGHLGGQSTKQVRCSDQMSQAGSVTACPAVHGWHDPGVFHEPVVMPAWETPILQGLMLPGTWQHGPVSL